MVNDYIGHPAQVCGVEEYYLAGGKGNGMHFYQVRNGKGLEFTVSVDRCMDISRLSFKGINCSFLSPAGYVAPHYFHEQGKEFLKSFTCGFLTTCGLKNVGPPCENNGESLCLHGTASNIPADYSYFEQSDKQIEIKGIMRDEAIFGDKLQLTRSITCNLFQNYVEICDRIVNTGDRETPLMVLYHFNAGYPLLTEKAELYIGSDKVLPRDEEAAKGIKTWQIIEKPQVQYKEKCFYHKLEREGKAGIFNREHNIGFMMKFDINELGKFTQWKMMGKRDYVMGLEPGNCNPEGQNSLRKNRELETILPGEERVFGIRLDFFDNYQDWQLRKQEA